MQKKEYQRIEKLENIHFWYRAMKNIVLSIVRENIANNTNILDAGCGTGDLAKELEQFGPVTAVDISDVALSYAKKKRISKLQKASVCDLPFSNGAFGLVVSLDVLYHKGVTDDRKALREFYRVLKKNGFLILRLPAFKFLYGSHDVIVHTKRRYSAREVRDKVSQAGFNVEKLTYLNMTLGIPLTAKRMIERVRKIKRNRSDTVLLPSAVNEIFYNILTFENKMLKYMSLPYGSSVLAVCRKE